MTDAQRKEIEEMIATAFGGPRIVCSKPSTKPYVIEYDSGFGYGKEIVHATSIEEATQQAYNRAAEIWESNMLRRAREFDPLTDAHLEKA